MNLVSDRGRRFGVAQKSLRALATGALRQGAILAAGAVLLSIGACGGGGGGGPAASEADFVGTLVGLGSSNSAGLEGGSIVLKGNDGKTYSLSSVSGPVSLRVTGTGGKASLTVERHPPNQICTLTASEPSLPGSGSIGISCVYTPINDTGLTQCMTGVDCRLQDAGAGRAALGAQLGLVNSRSTAGFDYTRICNNGRSEGSDGCILSDTARPGMGDSDWGCTRDNVTGLVWLARDFAGRYKQNDAIGLAFTQKWCGRLATTWRLPSVDQLHSLIYSAGTAVGNATVAAQLTALPMLDIARRNREDNTPDGAFDVIRSGYWSSTRATASVGWSVLFQGAGRVQTAAAETDELRVVPVSTDDLSARFADSYHRLGRWSADLTKGTLLDRHTGLMWMICSAGKTFRSSPAACTGTAASYSFSGALLDSDMVSKDVSRNLGYSDWRLPNRSELASLVDCLRWRPFQITDSSDVRTPSCESDAFKGLSNFDLGVSPGSFWTSSWVPSGVVAGGEAFTVDFSTGLVGLEPDLGLPLFVRYVRSAR